MKSAINKSKTKIFFLGITLCFALISIPTFTSACDIAVVSASASSTGRPFIWKNRDDPYDWRQRIKYFNSADNRVEGYICVLGTAEVIIPDISSGGVNEAGFAITNTTVYESDIFHEIFNANSTLMTSALEQCVTIEDFDALISNFHEDSENETNIISGNFAVIDAFGGAALYEAWTGEGLPAYTAPIMFYKIDANTGDVTDEYGILVGRNGVVDSIDNDNDFRGFVNRTNSNTWIQHTSDTDREERAYEMMSDMAMTNRLNHRNFLLEVVKDISGDVDKTGLESFDTNSSISRALTNLAFVVDGVVPGGDARLSTFWCNLGEPSVGVSSPYFPFAGEVTPYAWADNEDWQQNPIDLSPTSILNTMINDLEVPYLYDNNGVGLQKIDHTIDYPRLLEVQEWAIPLESFILDRTEELLDIIRLDGSMLSQKLLSTFSHFSAGYLYENYTNRSNTYYEWDFDDKIEEIKWKTPVANAGEDQIVAQGDKVTLDGSGSSDQDDGIGSFRWIQTSGIAVALSDSTNEKPTFKAPEVANDNEILTFELTVTDKGGLFNTDSCSVTIDINISPHSLEKESSEQVGGCFISTVF